MKSEREREREREVGCEIQSVVEVPRNIGITVVIIYILLLKEP
jgi:hypothetical protein